VRILTEERNKKVKDLLLGKKVTAVVQARTGQELLRPATRQRADARAADPAEILRLPVDERRLLDAVEIALPEDDSHIDVLHRVNRGAHGLLQKGDEPAPGVIKLLQVYVAMKRKLQSATRWPASTSTRASSRASCPRRTCRTSRTGLRSRIVLEPAGVPSRMNVGQILETHLGWADGPWGLHSRRRSSTAHGRPTSRTSWRNPAGGRPDLDGMTGDGIRTER